MKNPHVNVQELYDEVVARALENAVDTKDVWDDIVQEIIEEHLEDGRLDSDDDYEGMITELKDRWAEFEQANYYEE